MQRQGDRPTRRQGDRPTRRQGDRLTRRQAERPAQSAQRLTQRPPQGLMQRPGGQTLVLKLAKSRSYNEAKKELTESLFKVNRCSGGLPA